ncbi:hypothetical protein IQ07DRAFT_569907 [Pyrenochaeta sp. DS3sAY3a]|nr:hypothetical protein IQ07DRAFT_569907 [Pyrenochaeta sp. DS3sAY3a]
MTQPPSLSNSSFPPEDPFDTLLTLEDTLYTTAYTAGTTAGAHAGRIEGRLFGLENGFDKFAALGALHGRSAVWAARLPSLKDRGQSELVTGGGRGRGDSKEASKLPDLPETARLTNNITLLHSLTDPHTFSTDNTEDSVADFDDRFKRAGAKTKVVERIVGETLSSESELESTPNATTGEPQSNEGEVPLKQTSSSMGRGDDSMEDFAGSKLLR